MEATAKATYIRIAPRKVQIVLDLIRNKPADEAMAILKHTPKAACEPLEKLLKSAIANAEVKNMDVTTFPNTFPNIISNISDKFLSRCFLSNAFNIIMYSDKKAREIIGTTQLASLLILE